MTEEEPEDTPLYDRHRPELIADEHGRTLFKNKEDIPYNWTIEQIEDDMRYFGFWFHRPVEDRELMIRILEHKITMRDRRINSRISIIALIVAIIGAVLGIVIQ